MANLIRIDAELVRRGLARSRAEASELIKAGQVLLDGTEVLKPARQMDRAQALVVREKQTITYASRGAYKLLSALEYLEAHHWPVSLQNQVVLDAGASTGGFTDVVLRCGAEKVYAVDVGYGQLAWALRTHPAVDVRERTNVRYLQPPDFDPSPNWVVADLSFISLTLVIPALYRVTAPEASFLLMVKPQFEVGKGRLGSGGVVKDPTDHEKTIIKVARCALDLGANLHAVAPSFLPGPAGNVEYFVYFSKPTVGSHTVPMTDDQLSQMVQQAVLVGPAKNGQALAKNISHGNYKMSESHVSEGVSVGEKSEYGVVGRKR